VDFRCHPDATDTYKVFERACFGPLRRIPGPWHTIFTGLVLRKHTLKGERLHYVHRLHKTYGPVVRISSSEVDIADPGGFHEIHKIGSGFVKGPWYQKFRSGGVNCFTATDPKVHARKRKALARPFSKSSLRENWESAVMKTARNTVAQIQSEAEQGNADVLKWWTFMTTDIIGQLSFGESFGMVDSGKASGLLLVRLGII
jgi:cytochrome P450